MPAQNKDSEFAGARAVAEAKRQEAHRQAQQIFETERARITEDRTALYESARRAFEAVKSDPAHPDYDRARAEFARIGSANYQPAHQALHAAISAADAEFNSTLDRLRHEQLARDLAAGAVQNAPIRR